MTKQKLDLSPGAFINLTLAFIIVFSVWALYIVRFDKIDQFVIITLLSVIYFIWSLVYHFTKGDLTNKKLIEYFLFGALVVTIAYLLFVQV